MGKLDTRVPDELEAEMAAWFEVGENRSTFVRTAISNEIRRRRSLADIEAYRGQPETSEELAQAEVNARALITEEPW
jgi:metal-responsive CopG/Arc/MetJ family transcriptional regulator